MTALTGHVFHRQGRRGLGCPRDEWPGDSPAADAASQHSASRARTRRAAGRGGGTAGLRVRRLHVTQRVVSTVWDSIRAPRPASRARPGAGPRGAPTVGGRGRGRAAALSSASDFCAPRVSTGPASAAQKGRGSAPGTRRAPALRCARRTWLSAAVSTRFSLKTAFCLVSECFSSTRLITAAFETALPSAGKAQLGFFPFSKNRCFLIGVYGAFSALSHADPSSM